MADPLDVTKRREEQERIERGGEQWLKNRRVAASELMRMPMFRNFIRDVVDGELDIETTCLVDGDPYKTHYFLGQREAGLRILERLETLNPGSKQTLLATKENDDVRV